MLYFNESHECNTADEAWLYWWNKLSSNVDNEESRDGNIVGEIINATTTINDPTRSFSNNKVRRLPLRYCIGEMLWYASGKKELKEIQKFTTGWDRLTDDGENVNSNYGYCIMYKYGFNQLEQVIEQLRKNPRTRQAVIHIKEARNLIENPTKDVNCTVCLQFFIRQDKLYMITYMRSCDLWLGFPNDIFQFMNLQVYLSMVLGVGLGTYTHICGSLHLYERDYLLVKEREKDKI